MTHYQLAGLGIGLFNLSLASLLEKAPQIKARFFDRKKSFDWHAELSFEDSIMQTSYIKDLVTPIDPTNPNSFLNYLVQKGLIYSFLNTGRTAITRKEFEQYCQWVSLNLQEKLEFGVDIQGIQHKNNQFVIHTSASEFTAQHLCIGTGLTPYIPEFAEVSVGPEVFHAKSSHLQNLNLTGKRLVIVGGGQTGLEIFRNAMADQWGRAHSIQLISSRANLEPLDNSPFVNEYFTPRYVEEFRQLEPQLKDPIVSHQKLASDGNTPEYLDILYRDLYMRKNVYGDPRDLQLLPYRRVENLIKGENQYHLVIRNGFNRQMEELKADVVIFCTGFRSHLPAFLDDLKKSLPIDPQGRLTLNSNFALDWEHSPQNKIYAVNFSRHGHGISEPQTSLMAWRSALIVNDLCNHQLYPTTNSVGNFVSYLKK